MHITVKLSSSEKISHNALFCLLPVLYPGSTVTDFYQLSILCPISRVLCVYCLSVCCVCCLLADHVLTASCNFYH